MDTSVQWRRSTAPTTSRRRRGVYVLPEGTKPLRILWTVTLSLLCFSLALAQGPTFLAVGLFSELPPGTALPEGWKPLTFNNIDRYTVYRLVADGESTVVQALSEAGASGITKEVNIDPEEYPIIQWRWKVVNVLKKGDVTRKEGDDYPARIYVTFEYNSDRVGLLDKAKYEAIRLLYGRYPPLGAINYIWESSAPVGTLVPNPFTDQVMMFVLQSGPELLNTWVKEERNIYEDYKLAFGQNPPMISGVAIMTDTDNTQESATAFFGDIVFRKAL